jgi:hypothetical protein
MRDIYSIQYYNYIKVFKQNIMSIKAYVTYKAMTELRYYIEANKTKQEQRDYYMSDDYGIHLDYLIETWVSHIKNVFWENGILLSDDGVVNFDDIICFHRKWLGNKIFFDTDWLDDIFERHILVTSAVSLK